MWRGTPFADVPPTPSVEAESTRLGELRLQAVDARIDADLRCGRHADVLGELEALTAEHPYREGLRGRLMLALYRSGRQADALAAYRDLHRLLAEELGVEPIPPLQRLQQRILTADASLLAPPAPAQGGEARRPGPAPGRPRPAPAAARQPGVHRAPRRSGGDPGPPGPRGRRGSRTTKGAKETNAIRAAPW